MFFINQTPAFLFISALTFLMTSFVYCPKEPEDVVESTNKEQEYVLEKFCEIDRTRMRTRGSTNRLEVEEVAKCMRLLNCMKSPPSYEMISYVAMYMHPYLLNAIFSRMTREEINTVHHRHNLLQRVIMRWKNCDGIPKLCKILLKYGADPNKRGNIIHSDDPSPLDEIIQKGLMTGTLLNDQDPQLAFRILDLLVSYGANLTKLDINKFVDVHYPRKYVNEFCARVKQLYGWQCSLYERQRSMLLSVRGQARAFHTSSAALLAIIGRPMGANAGKRNVNGISVHRVPTRLPAYPDNIADRLIEAGFDPHVVGRRRATVHVTPTRISLWSTTILGYASSVLSAIRNVVPCSRNNRLSDVPTILDLTQASRDPEDILSGAAHAHLTAGAAAEIAHRKNL